MQQLTITMRVKALNLDFNMKKNILLNIGLVIGGNLSGLILITRAGGSQGVQLIFTTGINNVAAGTTTNPGTGGYLNACTKVITTYAI